MLKNLYLFLSLFFFSIFFCQNTEIKDNAGSLVTTPNFYCQGSVFNLQVDDYFSNSTATTNTLPIGTFNSILNDTTGEQNVPFSAPAGTLNMFSLPIDLGFNFKFYNTTYTKVVLGTNGRLVFTNDPVLNNLNETSNFIDRTFTSPAVPLPSPKYNQVYKTGDVTREIKMAQIFAGFTNLRINPATGFFKYKKFNTGTNAGILISFQSVIPSLNGTDLGPIFTSRVILFDDGRVVLNVINKTAGGYNAILGIQNENGDLWEVPTHSNTAYNYNNGVWASESTNAFVYTTGSKRTPTYLWELDRNNDGTIDQTANTRFFPNYTPTSDVEKLSVKITFLETTDVKTSSVEFRKIKTPVIEGKLDCAYDMQVNNATYDAGMRYTWFRVGDPTQLAIGRTFSIHRAGGTVGDYYVKISKSDGTPVCPGADESNKLHYEKQKFPGLVKTDYYFCDNSASPANNKIINLYDEFYPKYNPASGLEPYQIVFSANGAVLTDSEAQNFSVPANQEVLIGFAVKEQNGINTCHNGVLHAYFLSFKNQETISLCSSVTTYNLKAFFQKPTYPLFYTYNYTYSDGTSAGDGSSVDITKTVLVKVNLFGANCSTTTTVNFVIGTTMTVPDVPVQEKCTGSQSNPSDWFDLNLVKNILDPSGSYNVEFYRKSNGTQIVVGSDYTATGLFWTGTTGDYRIYAKVINKTDPTCFAISNDIILRVYVRPTAATDYQSKLKRRACGISNIDLTVAHAFDVINTNTVNQTPAMKYYDGSGNELIGSEITNYDISRGTPYLLVQNGVCNPPLKLNYQIISTLFPLNSASPKILCDVLDGNPDGIMKVKIASNDLKNEFTPIYANATFEYYDGTTLIHTSNQLDDAFEYAVNNNKVITVKVWSADFCTNQSTVTFKVNVPTAITLSGNLELCYGENLSLNIDNYADFSSSTVKWIDSKGAILGTGPNININYANVLFGETYKVTAQNNAGCNSEITFIPTKNNQPVIDQIIQTGNSIEVIARGGQQPYEYFFNGVSNGGNNILTNPTLPQYIVQVKSATGCIGEPKTVYFIKILNAFTPNSDGINDYWTIENLGKMQNIEVKVFDKFGAIVYDYATNNVSTTTSSYPGSSSVKDPVWDGKYNGRSLPTSTYWYVVKWLDPVTGKNEIRQGWILLKNRN